MPLEAPVTSATQPCRRSAGTPGRLFWNLNQTVPNSGYNDKLG